MPIIFSWYRGAASLYVRRHSAKVMVCVAVDQPHPVCMGPAPRAPTWTCWTRPRLWRGLHSNIHYLIAGACEQEWLWRSLNEFTRRIHIRAYKHTYSYMHKPFFHSAEFGVSRTVQLCINVFMYVHVLYICMHVCGRIVSTISSLHAYHRDKMSNKYLYVCMYVWISVSRLHAMNARLSTLTCRRKFWQTLLRRGCYSSRGTRRFDRKRIILNRRWF